MNNEIKFAEQPMQLHSKVMRDMNAKYRYGGMVKPMEKGPCEIVAYSPPRGRSTELSPIPNADDADEIEYEDTDGRTLAHYAIAFIFWFGRTLLWAGLLLLSVAKWIIRQFVSSLPEPSLDTDFHTPTRKRTDGRTIIVNQNVNIYE